MSQTLENWIGRSQQIEETLSDWPLIGMNATLDRPNQRDQIAEGSPLPPLWHWLYFLPREPASEIGPDGHARRGGFLPPVDLPRRMWAGGRLTFHNPVKVGDRAVKRSTIKAVTEKNGRSGKLVFVTVGHQVIVNDELCIDEEQDIVYREAPTPDASGTNTPAPSPPAPPGETPDWQATITPDAVMLFRYSALTFNGHRIHYDIDFCRDHEGYPGLVFHGPLTATLLADMAANKSGKPLNSFSYRGTAPLFHDQPFTLNGCLDNETAKLWALTPEGALAMLAKASF